jgi:hypothetical protein
LPSLPGAANIAGMAGRLVLAAVAAALLLPAAPAAAMSCPVPAPLPRLQAADAAIVGEFLPRDEDGAYRLAVRERIKGDVGDVVEIPGARPGTSISTAPDFPPGFVTGLFLARSGAAWAAGTCDTVDPGMLRAAARADRAGRTCHLPSIAVVRTARHGRHVRVAARVVDRDGRPHSVTISFGDGVSEQRPVVPRGRHSGTVGFGHRFRADRVYVVTLRAFARTRGLCGGTELSPERRVRVRVS